MMTGTFSFTSFALEYIFFNNMSRFFLFFSFFLFLLIYHKTLFDKVTGVRYRIIFVIYETQPAKSINFLIYIKLHVVLFII